jgi:drug/metabolite transporter (DMT)-like permease
VLIKRGLGDIPPLQFVGLRYAIAFLCLVPLVLTPARLAALRGLTRRDVGLLLALGLVQYALTQAAQFLSLAYLPATTASLLLAFTPLLVALMSGILLGEPIRARQWVGIAIFLAGIAAYFSRYSLSAAAQIGIAIGLCGVVANAGQALLGRYVNRSAHLPPTVVTTVSMGIGAAILLATALAAEGVPVLARDSWLTIAWLAVVNTAFAFTLWNHTQRTLGATDSSLINNTMLIQIAILAWLFLGERPTALQLTGLAVAAVGILIVQLPRRRAR